MAYNKPYIVCSAISNIFTEYISYKTSKIKIFYCIISYGIWYILLFPIYPTYYNSRKALKAARITIITAPGKKLH